MAVNGHLTTVIIFHLLLTSCRSQLRLKYTDINARAVISQQLMYKIVCREEI